MPNVEMRYYKCGRCGRTLDLPKGQTPGDCLCKTRHPYPWLLSWTPWAKVKGFGVVHNGNGQAQQLTASKKWQEDPDGWADPKDVYRKIEEENEKR